MSGPFDARRLASPGQVNQVCLTDSCIPPFLSPHAAASCVITCSTTAHTLLSASTSQVLQDGEDLRFRLETTASNETPYWLQGYGEFSSPTMLAMRLALRQDARVMHELESFWKVYAKQADSTVSKGEYLAVHVKFALVLIPDTTPEEALRAAEDDWASDAKGAANMSKECLFDCLFELTDMWCTGIDGGEYATFLDNLFKRITVKVTTSADGRVVVQGPALPTVKRKNKFDEFRDTRRINKGLKPLSQTPAALAKLDAIAAATKTAEGADTVQTATSSGMTGPEPPTLSQPACASTH